MFGKIFNTIASIGLIICVNGCKLGGPRTRIGTLPTPPPGPRFADPDNLGKHSYQFNPFETNAIVYTCKAGHLDITHIRYNADHTRHLIRKIRKTMLKKGDGFTFRLSIERTRHKVKFGYPEYWDNLSHHEKKMFADAIAFEIGPYLSYNATLWHEILTWFGVHFIGFEPEFNSSFSWEDIYSNLLGTKLAVEAMKDTKHSYNKAMTLVIDRKLKELGAQPRAVAIQASEKMRGKWYSGFLFVDMLRRNMDVGIDDGFVTPTLVPGFCPGVEPELLGVPTTDILSKYGFSMDYKIYPNEWEKDEILRVIYPNGDGKYATPEKHFSILMRYIRREAVEKYSFIIN